MVTRCNVKKQGPLSFLVVFVCMIALIKYSGKSEEVKSTIPYKIEQSLYSEKVVPDSQTDKPYLIPNDEILSKLNESDLMQIYWRYVNTLQILCRNQTRLGSFKDGGKEVCLDNNYKPTKPCVVYSFGSGFMFDFDLDVHYSFGCDVYTFDPSMNITGKGKDRKIPDVITFKEVGLSGKDHVTSSNWRMKTLKTVMKETGHEKTTIDIVKIDIEGAEWDAIPNFLQSGAYMHIRQLLVEFHFGYHMSRPADGYWGNMNMAKQLRALRMLYEYGFRIFMKERVQAHPVNLQGRKIMPQNELCFLNAAFL